MTINNIRYLCKIRLQPKMSGDTWLLQYENCVQLGLQIMEAVTDRNKEAKGSSSHSKLSAQIRSSLKQYSADVNRLREGLIQSSAHRRITERESERRQAKMDELITKQKRLENAYQNDRASHAGERSSLMRSSNPFDDASPWTGNADTGYGDRDDDPLLGIHEIRDQQAQIIREQDAGLDALSSVLGRQKQMALDIGNEVDYQNEIIDDIHGQVENTDHRIVRETKHIRIIDRKSGTCWFWVLAGLLFVAILVVLFVPYNGKI